MTIINIVDALCMTNIKAGKKRKHILLTFINIMKLCKLLSDSAIMLFSHLRYFTVFFYEHKMLK